MWINAKIVVVLLPLFLLIGFTTSAQSNDSEEIQLAQYYYQQGDVDKSYVLFQKLAKKEQNLPYIHQTYLELMLNTQKFNEAEDYIEKRVKRSPEDLYLLTDKAIVYTRSQNAAAQKAFDQAIELAVKQSNSIRPYGNYLINKQLTEQAEKLFLSARKAYREPYAFANDLALVYRILGKKQAMVDEYLNYLETNPAAMNYVQNSLQIFLTEKEDKEAMEQLLLDKIQSNPSNTNYAELLVWNYLQQKNFREAYIQARALDRRAKKEGQQLFSIAHIATENKEYELAINIYQYVIDQYPDEITYITAKRSQIKAREELIKNTLPVNTLQVNELIQEYKKLVAQYGINKNTQEALRQQALLQAFYLNQLDTAIQILENLVASPQVGPHFKSQVKLDLGDIFILYQQPWESALLYAQVEKAERQSPLGYEAKLKNAQLSFYQGKYTLAQSHLDILKKATTREIANDAIQMSLLIKDNLGYDSTTTELDIYSFARFRSFIQDYRSAKDTLEYLVKTKPTHNVADEAYWLLADIAKKEGDFLQAITYLQEITTHFSYDILADDALYTIGVIQQEYLKEDAQAMQSFEKLLFEYPGSMFVEEARKRFRTLRGDFVN
ncbi:tetratricopeptide repeat protein [Cytophagales bacterium LB-30]|uniref:Tetratricopeptide repeat protein n=1 Tax=Shiella aurantiaca TaxID=3058365 RepID=A0ABT8F5D5_9BACT|nr:tetratricopeptide repeat protein [Shiella aurantiaca]MDN4165593.1 tetratricopeptide repeat protein [Shiella aurantiaca]